MARERKKYSSELKHEVVQDYLEGNGSLRKLCKQYGILNHGRAIAFCPVILQAMDADQLTNGITQVTAVLAPGSNAMGLTVYKLNRYVAEFTK